jgi:hypothetical protein
MDFEGTASMPRQRLNKFSWENARSSLKGYDRDGLLQLSGDLYHLNFERLWQNTAAAG